MTSQLVNSSRCSLLYLMQVLSVTIMLSIIVSLSYSLARLSTGHSSMQTITSQMRIVCLRCTAPANPKTTQFSATSAKTVLFPRIWNNPSMRRTLSSPTTLKTSSQKSLKNLSLVPQPKSTTRKASCKTMDPTSNV